MAAASTALLLDPLAEDSRQPTNAVTSPQPANGRHGETAAPELAGSRAAEAVAAVRALGLIAAIEGLDTHDPDQHGVVVEQDPPAGTRLGREGIVVLRVGQPADELTDQERPVVEEPPTGGGLAGAEHDTEEWFTTLVQPSSSQPRVPRSSSNAPREWRDDDAQSAPRTTPTRPLDPARHLPWRTVSLLIAGVALGALTIDVLAGHAHSRVAVNRASRSGLTVTATAASAPQPSRPRTRTHARAPHARRHSSRPIAERHATATAPRARHPIPAQPAPHAAIQSAAPPAGLSSATGAGERAGQFSYLGQ